MPDRRKREVRPLGLAHKTCFVTSPFRAKRYRCVEHALCWCGRSRSDGAGRGTSGGCGGFSGCGRNSVAIPASQKPLRCSCSCNSPKPKTGRHQDFLYWRQDKDLRRFRRVAQSTFSTDSCNTAGNRGTPRIYDLQFMIYDWKAEGRDMRTSATPKPESPPLAGQTCHGFLLRGLRVWVPKRIIPRLGALSVVTIRAKRAQWAGANHAKRTQSRQGRAGRGLRDVGRAANAQNEPNLPGGAGRPSPAPRPSGLAPVGSDYAKQSQPWENWGRWARAGIVCRATSPESGTCETNPISGRCRVERGAGGLSCETKPIYGVGPTGWVWNPLPDAGRTPLRSERWVAN